MNQNLLIKVAKLYYEESNTQQEIADKLSLSRPQISKLLKKAREENIVKFEVINGESAYNDLEIELSKKFSLKEVLIAPYSENLLKNLAIKAEEFLNRIIRDNLIISFSWGNTLRFFVENINLYRKFKIESIPLMGGMSKFGSDITSSEIVRIFSEKVKGVHYVVHAPIIVSNPDIRKALMKEEMVREIFKKAIGSNFSFVGIGSLSPLSTMVKGGYLPKKDFHNLKENGIIGDVCTTFFNSQGKIIRTSLDDRIIGLRVEDLKKNSTIVGIAGGEEKKEAILAALRGQFIDILITDENTGNFLNKI